MEEQNSAGQRRSQDVPKKMKALQYDILSYMRIYDSGTNTTGQIFGAGKI
jgi:hypothetical protein